MDRDPKPWFKKPFLGFRIETDNSIYETTDYNSFKASVDPSNFDVNREVYRVELTPPEIEGSYDIQTLLEEAVEEIGAENVASYLEQNLDANVEQSSSWTYEISSSEGIGDEDILTSFSKLAETVRENLGCKEDSEAKKMEEQAIKHLDTIYDADGSSPPTLNTSRTTSGP